MEELTIIGIYVMDRIKESGRTQKVLSQYSNCISTRFGYHENSDYKCSRSGLIILELSNEDEARTKLLIEELDDIGGIIVKQMNF